MVKALKLLGAGLVGLLVLAFIAVFLVVPGPMISTAARTGEGMLFAEVDGRDAVIIAYDDNGYSGLGFFLPWNQGGRITALDLDTGETIWNAGLGDGESASLTRMLAAGEKYAYLNTTFGFRVVSLADGSTVATEDDFADAVDFADLTTEIVFSPSQQAIMIGADDAPVRKIPLDTLEIVDVDARTADTWSCVLTWNGQPYSSSDGEATLVERMPVGGEILGFGLPSGSAPGTPGKRLTRLNDDGSGVTVGSSTFVTPGFVAAATLREPAAGRCPTAQWNDDVFPEGRVAAEPLGAGAGIAVIDHAQNARTDDRQITVVDAASGEVLATSPAENGLADAGTAPSGQSVVVVDRFRPGILPSWGTTPVTATILLIAEDGSMRELVLAPHGWLGLPW